MPEDIRLVKHEEGKGLSTNDFTNEHKYKVEDIPNNPKYTDTVYNPPDKWPVMMIEETDSKRFVSNEEKTKWNRKIGSVGSRIVNDIAIIDNGESTWSIPAGSLIFELE